MAISNQGLPSYSFAMFLAFASFGSYIWSSDPLKTARPSSNDIPATSVSNVNSISARLWQDPFRVIYAGEKLNKGRDSSKNLPLRNEVNNYFENNRKEELLILGVTVSTEAIADAEERRRRNRYALITALSEEHFVPEDAGHIQVGSLSAASKEVKETITLPYEWFRYEAPKSVSNKKVLLLWLDASHYEKEPYIHIKQLISELITGVDVANKKKIRFMLLGPTGSGGLNTMIKKSFRKKDTAKTVQFLSAAEDKTVTLSPIFKEICDLNTGPIHILSSRATIGYSHLFGGKNNKLRQRFNLLNKSLNRTCITFHRTIHSDDQLMQLISEELKFRGVGDKHAHIVLLSELDTTFGRALPETFKQNFCSDGNKECLKHIHTFKYLRGIDGVAPGSIADIGLASSKSTKSEKIDNNKKAVSIVRRPIGAGQYDYLRRISDEIVKMDKDFRKHNATGIRAIGVLGTDVYDKLLILHALRSRLMGVTFFTTDLDAQFLHPEEFFWTRNMVVASSFDLKLATKWQGSTPPFRDSYQTSVYYSARLALQMTDDELSKDKEILEEVQPLLFEVGRNGAVPLHLPLKENEVEKIKECITESESSSHSHKEQEQEEQKCEVSPQYKLHPSNENKLPIQTLLLITTILMMFLFALYHLNSRARYQFYWLSAGLVVLVAVSAIGVWFAYKNEEPFIMLAGVSVWPTEIINSMTFMLSLYFICISRRAIVTNYNEIGTRYQLFRLEKDNRNNEIIEPKYDWAILVAILCTISAGVVCLFPETISSAFIYYMLLIWGIILAVWRKVIFKYLSVVSINKWFDGFDINIIQSIQTYWESYGEVGSQRNRCLRTGTVVLFFLAFVSVIIALFGMEAPPLRGENTRKIDLFITINSLLAMLYMLFYMVDATHLCIAWIHGLTKHTHKWDGTDVENIIKEFNIPESYAVNWLKLQIVAERTAEVGKLIFYPFIIIILMLFSRINYFDDWGFPQSLAIVTSCLIVIALFTAIKLRREAEKFRGDFIDELNKHKLSVGGNISLPDNPTLTQLNELVENVKKIRTGAFQPFLEQPLVKASLLLLGGVSLSASQFTYLL